ncbi:FG-GAP repeat protein [Haloarcula salinisoli]|uniref:FG-GAP repeat protein n=1 Tax=Haloarcula salinisoli TaxID=2487746 RepID=A0A8J8CAN3_9EURY|nr:FG-GAP repeat protein [Halomicroarcula salinisoli]MBX0303298.1 FG-GAP repeat protein [Halomicroarcula salinisoli]
MDNRRRRLLVALGTATAGAVAGCSGGPNDAGEQTGTPTMTGTPTPAGDSMASQEPPSEQTAKLRAGGEETTDSFGSAVELSGDGSTLVAASSSDESVHVISLTDGEWTETAQIEPDESGLGEVFGESVAVDGDGSTVLVGAPEDRSNDHEVGAAYVFSRSDGEWSQQAELTTDRPDEFLEVGISVSLSGDGSTALVGTPRADSTGTTGSTSGAAYVFSRSDGEWTQAWTLVGEDTGTLDMFGKTVALSADASTAVLGAPGYGGIDSEKDGAAYMFERSGGDWTQQAKFTADDEYSEDTFAPAVELSADGSTAMVGAPEPEDYSEEIGNAVYVFSQSDGEWTREDRLKPKGDPGEIYFGNTLSLSRDGSVALIGVTNIGYSAYVFAKSDDSWAQETRFMGDKGHLSAFGYDVGVSDSGGRVVVGAPAEGDPDREGSGAVYVYE